ncbi:RCC1 domain-containing protein 1 isoform X2 [Sceloporus undulatus]|uniref:RCC1 domain-containing protein 1 isoform X2 n=1 Tax=Sceloporus undulatus TaxID=8520 RepID=UPI001C4AA8AA|nr:RCC1 domain-containing protein 1 isoform X2 [Sceloporus undulatus]
MAGPGRGGGGGWFRWGFLLEAASGLPSVALGPERLLPGEGEGEAQGRVLAVRPSWSFLALLLDAGPGSSSSWVEFRGGGAGRRRLPGEARGALPSESHLLLLREDALEAWPLALGEGGLSLAQEPLWRREAQDPGQDPAAIARGLPLFPGGFVAPHPPFFWPLRGSFLRAERLALGLEHALLLLADGGGLFSWGGGRHGQLGHGGLESLSEPEPVEALQGLLVEAVAAGGWHSAALTGGAEKGPLDPLDATFVSIQAFPALLDLPDEAEVLKVSCGSRHTAALTRTGDLYTWGWGQYGQLGHGDTASSDRPRKVGCFADWDLCVVDVTCGPWATYVQADRRTTDPSLDRPEA